MVNDERYTAFCGLYCKDCIPSNKRLFQAAEALERTLGELHFEEYAAAKSENDPEFRDYPVFSRMLKTIRSLECRGSCVEGGCRPDCKIWACIRDKGYRGCWDCSSFQTCDLLEPLKAFHPGLVHNLEMIREYGPDSWSDRRAKHYRWS